MQLHTQSLRGALDCAPQLSQTFEALWAAVWSQPHIPAPVLELCRLQLAKMHRHGSDQMVRHPVAQRAGFDERKAQAVLAGGVDPAAPFSAAEQAVLAFTEQYAMDPGSITDALADDVKRHYGDTGLVTLIEATGFMDSRLRLASLLTQMLAEGSA